MSGAADEERGGEAPEPEPERRGVHNPRVVDLVTTEEDGDLVVLVMLEERPWGSDPVQLRQLEEKFNSYLSFVLDGHLARQFPEYEGRRVLFRLECAAPPRPEERPFLTAVENFAVGEGIGFEVRPRQP